MEKNQIVNQLIEKYVKIDFIKQPELANKSFFAKEINLMPRDLMLLMIEIENTCDIKFANDFIKEGGLKSYQSIMQYLSDFI